MNHPKTNIYPSTQSALHRTTTTTTTTPNYHSPAFLRHNGYPPLPSAARGPPADIEMVSFRPTVYTSLRDLLPTFLSPATAHPPSHNSSWCEDIPIKNPLVKHAAIAYLQPMSSPAGAGGKGILGTIKERCGCGGGEGAGCCLWWWWLSDAVSRIATAAGLGWGCPADGEAEDGEENDEEEEDYYKVD